MRFVTKFISGLLILGTAGLMSACSNDDDTVNNQVLDTPQYEDDAALYQITSTDSEYASIELTASGNYIILPSWMAYTRSVDRKSSFFFSNSNLTRAEYYGIIEGKYTKTGENTYNLQGFGTLTVVEDGGSTVNLEILLNNGNEINLTAAVKNQYADSEMTNNLCRTWNINDINIRIVIDGKTYLSHSFNKNNYKDYLDDYDEVMDFDDGFPEQVIFTKAGTYMVTYTNDALAVSTWSWVNQNQGTLRYSWDYDDMDNDYMAGTVKVEFPGNNRLVITETYTEDYDYDYDYDDDDDFYGDVQYIMVYNLSEVK